MKLKVELVIFPFLFFIYSPTFAFNCGNTDEKLQVHLVPHTHDDVGWQKTVDQYYYGSNVSIQAGSVQYILDTVMSELAENHDRTFIYVEIAFFKRWWDQQDEEVRAVVKGYVERKQLEFINAGWSMNDEAATHYNAIIDQMTLGLRFVNATFGPHARPTVAWHIDPFGHSAEQASLFSLMSFDGFFVGRIDEADKQKRLKEQRMEMVWRGSRNYNKASQIFAGVLYNGYSPPPGFCFDEFCIDPPIQDDPRVFDMNVQERVDAFVHETCKQAESYKTNHIILTMGADFQYENARRWYKNLDKLIRYVNEDGRVNAFYSTPSRYLEALHNARKQWEVKRDDFFPYSHCPHCYWTGYFTSRPALKGYIRESNNVLQACKQIEAIHGRYPNHRNSDTLRRAMAVNQHHDAVTGTEKQHVAYDYAKRLYQGREDCHGIMSLFMNEKYAKLHDNSSTVQFRYCDYLNISTCHITETEKSIFINIYNPIARPVRTYLKLPVNTKSIVVSGPKGENIKAQVIPVSKETARLQRSVRGFSTYDVIFEVLTPPIGFSTYFINQKDEVTSKEIEPQLTLPTPMQRGYDYIENDKLRLEFSVKTGRLVRMVRKDTKLTLKIDQQFFWYAGSEGDSESKQTSGAYIFRPNTSIPFEVCENNKAKVEIIRGDEVEEVRQTFGTFVTQVIRLYKHAPYAEFEHTIGPIPVVFDLVGKEIITRFDTNIESGATFYTDANGREIKKRIRDFRETWVLKVTEPISENYYPINSRIFIKDASTQLTVMSDRSQGGSSIRNGQIEIMLHRRLLKDDFLGVGEALNEPGVDGLGLVTRGKHRVFLSSPTEAARLHRPAGELMMLSPLTSFAVNPYTIKEWMSKFTPVYSALTTALPENVHLLTMETTEKDAIILRFEHYFEKDEDAVLSNPVGITLIGMFADFRILSYVEVNLSANQYLKDKRVMKWNTKEGKGKRGTYEKWKEGDSSGKKKSIQLKPMEIRTFLANIQRNH